MTTPYFDEVAGEWDELRQSFFSDAVREKAIARADVKGGQVAADVGAGSGFVTEGLLRKGLRVIAVDPSQAMLGEMRKKFPETAAIDYRLGEAERLPLADEEVDHVFANMCLHHVESPPHALEEMVRVLRPGGRLVLTDLEEHTLEFLRAEHHDRWMGFRREDVRRWLAAAGLRDVVVDSLGESCCAESASGGERAAVSIFIALGKK